MGVSTNDSGPFNESLETWWKIFHPGMTGGIVVDNVTVGNFENNLV